MTRKAFGMLLFGAAAVGCLPALVSAADQPDAEYDRNVDGLTFRSLGYPDAYARDTGHVGGWPTARDLRGDIRVGRD